MSPKKFLTAADIQELFGIDELSLQGLVDAGELKALADRGTWRYRREDIEALISSGRLHSSHELEAVDDIEFDESIGFASESEPSAFADFLELDEDALSGQSTVISSGPLPDASDVQLTFTEDPAQSSSDVHVIEPGDEVRSDSDILIREPAAEADTGDDLAAASSSDVEAIDESGLSDSTSDVTFFEQDAIPDFADPETAYTEELQAIDEVLNPGEVNLAETVDQISLDSDSDVTATLPADLLGETARTEEFDPSAFNFGSPAAEVASEDDASAVIDDDSLELAADESGISLEFADSGLALPVADEALDLDADDSGLTLETADSGLALEADDSGLTLETADSGLALEADSGITLDAADSGLMLDPGESGLTLELDPDDISSAPTLANMDQLSLDDDESAPTAVFVTGEDDEDYVETLSGAIDAGNEVEDLEIADDLHATLGDDEDIESLETDDEDILDAEDSAFSDEFSGEMDAEEDDEAYLTPSAKAKPREPSWGMFPSILVIASSVLVGVNAWLMWEGLATMWNGAEPSGAASTLISSIASMLG